MHADTKGQKQESAKISNYQQPHQKLMNALTPNADAYDVVVAGHVCVDIIPTFEGPSAR